MSARAIKSLGTILGVWAHPDDETWTSAGIIMKAVANGQRVVCVTATRGELGSQDLNKWPPKTLGAVRQKEMAAALQLLGINEHYWLDYPDGACDQVDSKAAQGQLEKIIHKVMPDSILTFGLDGLTGHPDHQTVGKWARATATNIKPSLPVYEAAVLAEQYEAFGKDSDKLLNIYFNTSQPQTIHNKDADIFLRLSPELLDRKITVLRAHLSQYEILLNYLKTGKVSPQLLQVECFRRAQNII